MDAADTLLQCRDISKRYGGECALDGVDFDLRQGEVHGLVGCNGAGKSTLTKILAGAVGDYEGQILIAGEPVRIDSPQLALSHGIAMVYQELSGVGQLSVAENLFLGRQPTSAMGRIDWRGMRQAATEYLAELDIHLDVTRRLDSFPLAVRQLVEIARGLHSGSQILILDEPTSALSPPEVRRLFELIRLAKSRQRSIIFISHFIEDVLEICDRVTVLRDGQHVRTASASELDKSSLIHAMLGHEQNSAEPGYLSGVTLPPRATAAEALECCELSYPGAFQQVTLSVARGELLGIYGFVGAGHAELAQCLAGARTPASGQVRLAGKPLGPGNIRQAIRAGVVFVGADRGQTLVLGSEIYKNVTLAHLRTSMGSWLVRRRETQIATPLLNRVGCRPANPRLTAGSLSGGNQQKVVIAKWLLGPASFWVLEEPTRGMDVQARAEILSLIDELRRAGAGIVLASSEPELVLQNADRILVMSRGRITREFVDCQLDKSTLMHYA